MDSSMYFVHLTWKLKLVLESMMNVNMEEKERKRNKK